MSAEPLKVCPECGGALRKLLYPVGVQFKGSGFYTTDYRNSGSKSKTDAGGSSDSNGSSGSSSSSESNGSSSSSEKKTETAASKE
jgi:hypothetical protein